MSDAPSPLAVGDWLARSDDLLAAARSGAVGIAAAVLDPPALVLGSAQPEADADAAACASAGTAVARRGTGGGAVLCDRGVLLVDVAVPAGHALGPVDVTDAYRPLGAALVDALGAIGIATRTVGVEEARTPDERRRAAARRACWAGLSPHEVLLDDGRKLVGLAQRRRGGAVLHQVALHAGSDPRRVADLLVDPDEVRPWLEATASLAEAPGGAGIDAEGAWAAIGPALGRLAAAGA